MIWTFVLAGFLFLLCGAPAFMVVRWQAAARRDVKKEIDLIRERGEPVTPLDVEDVYRLPEGTTDTTRLWMDASKVFASKEFGEAGQKLPIIGAQAIIQKPPIGKEWADLATAQQLLKTYDAALEKLHMAAAEGGAARYPNDFSKGFSMILTHIQDLRAAARVLELEAYVRAYEKDAAGVTRSLNTLLALEKSLANEPILVSQLVRIAVGSMANSTLEDLLPHVDFSEEQLLQLRDAMKQSDVNDGVYKGMVGERAIGYAIFDSANLTTELGVPALPMRDADRLLYLRQLRQRIELSKKPWQARKEGHEALDNELKQLIGGSPIEKFKYVVSAMVLPATGSVSMAAARSDAKTRLATTAIMIQIYRKRNGQLPDNLNQLVPDLLSEMPTDPYSGEPLRYERLGNGYKLYSVGQNGIDDGGKASEVPGELDVVFSVGVESDKSSADKPPEVESAANP